MLHHTLQEICPSNVLVTNDSDNDRRKTCASYRLGNPIDLTRAYTIDNHNKENRWYCKGLENKPRFSLYS